ncbi:MAG: hypothetical protein AB7F19_07025 [Candidatus Babeliales bacterium]
MKAALYAKVATKKEQLLTTHIVDGKKEYTHAYSTDGKSRVVGEMVKALLKADADITLKNSAGKTALMFAKDMEYQGAYVLLLEANKNL